jgi:hypothetical protein
MLDPKAYSVRLDTKQEITLVHFKPGLILVIAGLSVLFVIQNVAVVEMRFNDGAALSCKARLLTRHLVYNDFEIAPLYLQAVRAAPLARSMTVKAPPSML